MLRKIIHIDMDAFYASIEQRDNPEYRGRALVVGGLPEGRGGVVATASYEARKFGIRSAMSSKKALELCPEVIFLRPRFEVYKFVSQQIRAIFSRYTDLIEPLSLDEAFLDVTIDKQGIGSAIDIATAIRAAIRTELGLTASAGISVSKFLAKIASDMNKPDGQTFIGVTFELPALKDVSFQGATLKQVSFRTVGIWSMKRAIQSIRFDGAMMDKLTYAALKGIGADVSNVTVLS